MYSERQETSSGVLIRQMTGGNSLCVFSDDDGVRKASGTCSNLSNCTIISGVVLQFSQDKEVIDKKEIQVELQLE